MLYSSTLAFLALWGHFASAVATVTAAAPTVKLDKATVTGTVSSSRKSHKFLGIPFAQPPVGNLRFRFPQPIAPYASDFSATAFGHSCPQQAIKFPMKSSWMVEAMDSLVKSNYDAVIPDSEDCLTINVIKPATATPASKLPVVVWIYGGAFEIGGTSSYDGRKIVDRSIRLRSPLIYVSMNYRVSAFGFLASKEVRAAGVGNLGLQDQRQALRWVQKYIGAFGGDPTKVTIWGQSAGAISVSLHMIANDGDNEGLFRAGFMQSGSPIPVAGLENGQKYYDALVAQTGCTGTSDTLQCLREVPYKKLKAAQDASPGISAYQSLSLAWLPREDGVFLTKNPQQLVLDGKVSNVPFITGTCDDEGTVFSLSTLNITTTAELRTYITTVFLPGLNVSQDTIQRIERLYPADITQGSPFNTGTRNAITPQFKRIAAFMGDGVFQAPRRFFLQQRASKQPTWSFLSKRFKFLPILGSFHGSDMDNIYRGGEMTDYLIRFVVNLNPNGASRHRWPQYDLKKPRLLTFNDGFFPVITSDTYRKDAISALTDLMLAHPF